MRIFDLKNKQGSFETSPLSLPTGFRSFSLWSFSSASVGDLIVIHRPTPANANNAALYQITTAPTLDFTGEDGNSYWVNGQMIDVILNNLLNDEMVSALEARGLA